MDDIFLPVVVVAWAAAHAWCLVAALSERQAAGKARPLSRFELQSLANVPEPRSAVQVHGVDVSVERISEEA